MMAFRGVPGSRQPGFLSAVAPQGRGFTLIELLIVVAIISILAAIAVPNFLEAQTRAKVSRVKADARSISVAVESYYVDWNRYPPRQKFPAPLGGGLFGVGDVTKRTEDMSRFTTPISYITSLPIDIFERKIGAPENILDYYNPVLVEHMRSSRGLSPGFTYNPFDSSSFRYGYLILSVGPDGGFGNFQANLGNYPTRSPYNHWMEEYDPTNGTISEGNVYRFSSPGVNANVVFY